MPRFQRGDSVEIVARKTTAADRKSGRYYPHFAGLQGVVDQVYEEEGEVCVEVDLESLPPEFLRRHQWIEERMRQAWWEGLSEQERRALPEAQHHLRLKYTVIVSPDDLVPKGQKVRPSPEESTPRPATQSPVRRSRRPSQADLAAQEAAYLAELARRSQREQA